MNGDKLTVSFMNVHGQSNFTVSKQLQIQDILKYKNIDILNLQEVEISSDTFESCDYVNMNYCHSQTWLWLWPSDGLEPTPPHHPTTNF